jgi:Phosphoesterase family
VFREFVLLCRQLKLFGRELLAVDGTRIKGVNHKDRNFTRASLAEFIRLADAKLDDYLQRLDTSDVAEQPAGGSRVKDLAEKIAAVQSPANPPRYKFSILDGDPPHEFEDVLVQLCGPGDFLPGGKLKGGIYPDLKSPNDTGFVASYQQIGPETPERIMQGYGSSDMPALHALASEFAILDSWFASGCPPRGWSNGESECISGQARRRFPALLRFLSPRLQADSALPHHHRVGAPAAGS